MNVLLLTDGISPLVTGGMQKHSYYLTKFFLKEKCNVTLVHTANKIENEENVYEIFGKKYRAQLKLFFIPFPMGIRFPGHYLLRSWQYSKLISKEFEKKIDSFDLIYIQGFCGWHLLKKHRYKIKGKIITNFHGLEMFQPSVGFKSKIQAFLLRLFVKKNLIRSEFVQSLGGKLSLILEHELKINSSKILKIPIGLEENWITENIEKKNNNVLHFAFVGRNEKRKGFNTLEKFINNKNNDSRYRFHIIGPFEQKNTNNTIYYGLIKDENKLMQILDECDVLICPSFAEGMPTVILEAMSRGCLVIASNVGAVNEVVNSTNGILIEPNNYNSLEEACELCMNFSSEEIQLKKENARSTIKTKFLWKNVIEEILLVTRK